MDRTFVPQLIKTCILKNKIQKKSNRKGKVEYLYLYCYRPIGGSDKLRSFGPLLYKNRHNLP